ncbi:AMIN domain-containing protein [Nannocystaceae bacterium ST9]
MVRRRRSRVLFGSAALLVVGTLAAPLAWAGPPPPPPNAEQPPMRPGTGNTAPPPPDSVSDSGDAGGSRLEAPRDPLVIDQRTPETDMTGAWKYSRGGSSEPNYVRQSDEDPFFTVNPIGYYQGVSLSGGNTPPFAPREVGGQTAVLTWTGFERLESSSRVFFQLSAAVEPEVVVSADEVIVDLPRTSVQVRNNRRKLITRYFKTPVTEVQIHRKGKQVHAVIELRWPSEPTWSVQPGTNGYQLLVFEFSDASAKSEADTSSTQGQPPASGSPDSASSESEDAIDPEKAPDSTNPFLPTE